MPKKALVAFGTVLCLGLFLCSVPPWCSVTAWAEEDLPRAAESGPIETDEPAVSSPALTLEDALQRALAGSPKLATSAREREARAFDRRQAGLLPNPELSLELENAGGSGAYSGLESAETTVRISQLVELAGKRGKRKALARLDEALAAEEQAVVRAEVLAETRERFVAVLAAQERVALAEEQTALARRVLQAVEGRIATGETAPLEGVRFQTLVAEGTLRRERALRELAVARLLLASGWGSETADFSAAAGTLEGDLPLPAWPEVLALFQESPVLALGKTTLQRADGALALERAKGVPDLTLGLGVRTFRESGDHAAVASLSLPLPLFDRNRGGVGAARLRRARAGEAAREARLRRRGELAEAWGELSAAYGELTLLREEILPASRAIYEGVSYGYQAGKYGFLEVLDADRSLFEAKSRYLDALAASHRGLARIEGLLGRKITADGASSAATGNERGQL